MDDINLVLESIYKELGITDRIMDILSETTLRRLKPILLSAWKKRAQSMSPREMLDFYEENYQFLGISSISQAKLIDFSRACFAAVPHYFQIVETSPVNPLGLNSVLSSISQNNILSTIRDTELVGDVTSQLALECARQRRLYINEKKFMENVHLCSSHRVMRMQPFERDKGYLQHFNLLGLCSGGRSTKDSSFINKWVSQHISIIIKMVEHLSGLGLSISDISVKLSDIRFLDELIEKQKLSRDKIRRYTFDDSFDLFQDCQINFPREISSMSKFSEDIFLQNNLTNRFSYYLHLEEDIMIPLQKEFPNIQFCFDFTRKAGMGYYKHLCFRMFAKASSGLRIQIADGGAVDWLAKFLQNKKEGMVISGIGAELVQSVFQEK